MKPVILDLDIFDFGCLPGLLTKEIASVENHRRVAGYRYTADEAQSVEQYLSQLRGCLGAAEKVRASIYAAAIAKASPA